MSAQRFTCLLRVLCLPVAVSLVFGGLVLSAGCGGGSNEAQPVMQVSSDSASLPPEEDHVEGSEGQEQQQYSLFGAPPVFQPGALTYHKYYNKTRRPLYLDVSRIAVMDLSTKPENHNPVLSEPLRETLRRHGITEMEPLRHLFLAAVPENQHDHDAVKRLIQSILEDCPTAYVAPVFDDNEGHAPMVMTGRISMQFGGLTEEQRQVILASVNAEEVHIVGYGTIFRSRSRDGFEVLAATNTLAENPHVLYAAPEMISKAYLF